MFNPSEQLRKFDKEHHYIKKWLPEYNEERYLPEIVEHKEARLRALSVYRAGIL